jgi:DHA2 family multidrug resistance protein
MSASPNSANRGAITASVITATLMNTLDSTIANVALPHMQGSLSASPDQVTWVLTSYLVMVAVTTPLSGWLSSRLGMKLTFMIAIAGFTATSILCGIAVTLPQMVLFRAAQGAFGASVVPLSQAVLLDIYPPERHTHAMSLWATSTILGPILGPVIGGYITDGYSWRWCFFINLPIGLVAMLGVWLFMADARRVGPRKFDFVGYGALAVGVAALQFMLDRGPTLDWFASREICAEAVLAVSGLWVFVVQTLTARDPFFSPVLFRNRNLMISMGFSFCAGTLIFASLAILPLLMQSLMGFPALTAGLVSMPRGVGMMAATTLAGRLGGRIDRRLILLTGLICTAGAYWQMANFDLAMDARPLMLSGFLQGFGVGLFFVALTTLAFATVDPILRAEATSLYNLVRNLGASVGISIMQAIAVVNTQAMHASMAAHVTPTDPVVRAGLPAAFNPGTASGALALNGEITRQATMVAYVDDFRLMLGLTVFGLPLLMLLRTPRPTVVLGPPQAIGD